MLGVWALFANIGQRQMRLFTRNYSCKKFNSLRPNRMIDKRAFDDFDDFDKIIFSKLWFRLKEAKNNYKNQRWNSLSFLKTSFKFLINLLSSYEHLIHILWTLMNISWTSYEHIMNILWTSYEHLMNILWTSYEHLMNIYKQLTNIQQAALRQVTKSP